MSIASLGTAQVPQSLLAAGTAAAPASVTQGAFGTQLQSLLAGQSSTGGSAAPTAYQTEPGRGTPDRVHHHHGHHASGTDANAADGMENGQSTASAQGGTSHKTPGGLLLTDLMRGLRAYGATTTLR